MYNAHMSMVSRRYEYGDAPGNKSNQIRKEKNIGKVSVQTNRQITFLPKSFTANVAHLGLLYRTRVCLEVQFQRRSLSKLFVT